MHDLNSVLLSALATIVTAAVTAALGFVSSWLASKSKTNRLARVTARVWDVFSSVTAAAVMSPRFKEILADGKVTAEERKEAIVFILAEGKKALGAQGIDDVADVLKIGTAAVEPYLVGLIERALGNFANPNVSNAPQTALVAPGS